MFRKRNNGGDEMREKVHMPYMDILHYQHLARVSDKEVSDKLGYCVRTYKDKVHGYSDFSATDLLILSDLFKVPMDKLTATV